MNHDKCDIKGCGKQATHIGSLPETGIIDLCGDCHYAIYKS